MAVTNSRLLIEYLDETVSRKILTILDDEKCFIWLFVIYTDIATSKLWQITDSCNHKAHSPVIIDVQNKKYMNNIKSYTYFSFNC